MAFAGKNRSMEMNEEISKRYEELVNHTINRVIDFVSSDAGKKEIGKALDRLNNDLSRLSNTKPEDIEKKIDERKKQEEVLGKLKDINELQDALVKRKATDEAKTKDELSKAIAAVEKMDDKLNGAFGADRDDSVKLNAMIAQLEAGVSNMAQLEKDYEIATNGKDMALALSKILMDPEKNIREAVNNAMMDSINKSIAAMVNKMGFMEEKEIYKMLTDNAMFNEKADVIKRDMESITGKIKEFDDLTEIQKRKLERELATKISERLPGRLGKGRVKSSVEIGEERDNMISGILNGIFDISSNGIKVKDKMQEVATNLAEIYVLGEAQRQARALGASETHPYAKAVKNIRDNLSKYVEDIDAKLNLTAKAGAPKVESAVEKRSESTAKTTNTTTGSKHISYVTEYGWSQKDMKDWIKEYEAYTKANIFAAEASKKIEGYSKFEEQMQNSKLKIEDARLIYAEVMLAKAEHDFSDKKEQNHFNSTIKNLYDDFKKGTSDESRKEVTQIMYALDLAYEAKNNEVALREKVKGNKADSELLEKAISINEEMKIWLQGGKQYEYNELLKRLEKLNRDERERLYRLMRGLPTKAERVISPPENNVNGSSATIEASSTGATAETTAQQKEENTAAPAALRAPIGRR